MMLTDDQKDKIREFILREEGTPAEETVGESITKLLNLSEEQYHELEDEIEDFMTDFFVNG